MPFFAIPYPIIDPVLFQIGSFAVRWYALSYVFGIIIGWLYARRIVTNDRLWGPAGSPITRRRIDDFVIFATIGIVAGGRIGYVLVYDLQNFLDRPLQIFALWEGGMSFHGGLLGVVLATYFFARRTKLPIWSLIDIAAIVSPIGLFLGRLANFVNGELYGRVTDVPWAMVFPTGGEEPRHPSQLYQAGLEGILLAVALWYLASRRGKLQTPAFISGAFIAIYGGARTFAEFFRQPDAQIGQDGFLVGGLTMGMLLSVPMIIVGIATMIVVSRRSSGTPSAA